MKDLDTPTLNTENLPPYIGVKQVAWLCGGVSAKTIWNWAKDRPGFPKHIKRGGRAFWRRDDVIEAMEKGF